MEESIKVRNAYSEAMETFTDLSGYVTNHTTANTTANYDDGEKGVKGVVEKMEQVKDKKGEPVFKVDKTLFEEKPKKESSDIDVRNVIRIIRLVLFIGFILYAIFS